MHLLLPLASLFILAGPQTCSATSNAPYQTKVTKQGHAHDDTNQCDTGFNQSSECRNAFINNIADWCIWSPPQPGPDSVIGNTEQIEVAWCIKDGYGTRLIPDGTITGAHFVVTPDFVQVTGVGNLTMLNIPVGDSGLDPHGADGNGNPIGGLVFSNAFGQLDQIHEWTNFVSDSMFCFRACKSGPMAPVWCQHIYDLLGCEWNMPANYNPGAFEQCLGDSGEPMGVYGTSTFYQGEPTTPPAHPIPSSSSCMTVSSIGNALYVSGTSAGTVPPASATRSGTASHDSVPSSTGSSSSTSTVSKTEDNSTSPEPVPAPTTVAISGSAASTSSHNIGYSRSAPISNGDWLLFTTGTAFIGSLVGAILVF